MKTQLFSSYQIKDVTFKNRIVMSPMCMYSCYDHDGKVTDFHLTHYGSRAIGQVGLLIVEATGVTPQGRITENDLGIWSDEQIEGLKKLVNTVHTYGAKIGIQLAHAGRKSNVEGDIIAPSAIAFDEKSRTPKEMTEEEIKETIDAFKEGARRAKVAGFDVIELHGAHGYLINEFLSPLTNKRTDSYGGSAANRYRFLSEIIDAVKKEWSGPLFVRISADDYHPEGLKVKDYIEYANLMKAQGVDLIDCSSGAVVPAKYNVYPGYQVKYSETINKNAEIATGTVGFISEPLHAEELLQNKRADMIFLGRELLRNPYWPYAAAKILNDPALEAPVQYELGWR